MAIPDKFLLDFSGGMRGDKSDLVKQDNEVVRIVNLDINKTGKVKKRRGGHQLGQTISADNLENIFYFQRLVGGSTPEAFFLVNTNDANDTIKKLIGSRNTTALTTASGSIELDSVTGFTDTGDDDAEIEGDLFNYTGIAGSTLTGVTGLTSSHAANTAVHQWINLAADLFDGRKGISYAILNNLIYVQPNDGAAFTFNGSTFSAVTGEPNARFATTYRQRIYVTQYVAASSARVNFSDAGDPTTFTATNVFDVEGERGELGTGFRVLNDELLIFKTNSFFAYNEITLKQRNNLYGAYNHKVHKEINGLVYSFCPEGIFVTNGQSVEKISHPVEDWIKDFRPVRDSISNTIVTNTFSATFDDKYMLYVGDVTVDGVAYTDVVLVYDTRLKNWTVYIGFTNFQSLVGLNAFFYGGEIQNIQGLFGGDDSGKVYRFFSKTYTDADGNNRFTTDGDIFLDLISDTGNIVSAEMETKLYDLDSPNILKQLKYLRTLAEQGGFQISYRVEGETGLVKDWVSLGTTNSLNELSQFQQEARGLRVALKISHSDSNIAPTFNGFVFEETETVNKTRKIKQ